MSYDGENSSDSRSKPAFSNSPDDQLHVAEEEVIGLAHGIPVAFGKRLYGVVDRVPGVFYVATFFYHVFWLPIFPVESWIFVTDSHGYEKARSMPLPLNMKSAVVGWTRAFCVVIGTMGILASFGTLLFLASGRASLPEFVNAFVCAVSAIVLYWFTQAIGGASPSKAEQLAVRAGFPPGAIQVLIETTRDGAFESVEREPSTMPCPSCGRMLSSTSRICPRCEHRLR